MHHRALAASFAAAQRRSAGARFASTEVPRKALVTASLNGVLTDPKKWPQVPVTPEAMALEAARAYEAGATVVHIHLRDQRPGKGHLPSWDPAVAADVCDAIRARSPVLINLTTGTMGAAGSPLGGGALGPTAGPIACLERVRPAMAALNAGSLNYLRTKADGSWAWPPLLFDNPVSKVAPKL
jgi:3-keto-5-aminohexanoate cleavage enzyme